jgi:hypothetical protein
MPRSLSTLLQKERAIPSNRGKARKRLLETNEGRDGQDPEEADDDKA